MSANSDVSEAMEAAAQKWGAPAAPFLAKAVAAGVAGDLGSDADTGGYGYVGDPADLEDAPAPTPLYPGAPARVRAHREFAFNAVPEPITLVFTDGSEQEVHPDPLTMERIDRFNYITNRVDVLNRNLMAVKWGDEAGLERASRRVREARKAQIVYFIPDFPAERFGEMLASTYMELAALLDEERRKVASDLGNETDEDGDPNPSSQRR